MPEVVFKRGVYSSVTASSAIQLLIQGDGVAKSVLTNLAGSQSTIRINDSIVNLTPFGMKFIGWNSIVCYIGNLTPSLPPSSADSYGYVVVE